MRSTSSTSYDEVFQTEKKGSSNAHARTKEFSAQESHGAESSYSQTLDSMTGSSQSVTVSITFNSGLLGYIPQQRACFAYISLCGLLQYLSWQTQNLEPLLICCKRQRDVLLCNFVYAFHVT